MMTNSEILRVSVGIIVPIVIILIIGIDIYIDVNNYKRKQGLIVSRRALKYFNDTVSKIDFLSVYKNRPLDFMIYLMYHGLKDMTGDEQYILAKNEKFRDYNNRNMDKLYWLCLCDMCHDNINKIFNVPPNSSDYSQTTLLSNADDLANLVYNIFALNGTTMDHMYDTSTGLFEPQK